MVTSARNFVFCVDVVFGAGDAVTCGDRVGVPAEAGRVPQLHAAPNPAAVSMQSHATMWGRRRFTADTSAV